MEETHLADDFKIVVIGGSAGSLSVLFEILPVLSDRILAAIVLVLHRKNSSDSSLSELLASKTTLPTVEIDDKDSILPGHIYLAPADYHLLLEKNHLFSLDSSEKINFSRPSLDVTYESAADAFGPAVIGILLSGSNEDGTAGLRAVKDAGGLTVVQKPSTAQMPFMPQHAIDNLKVDKILSTNEIAEFLNLLG